MMRRTSFCKSAKLLYTKSGKSVSQLSNGMKVLTYNILGGVSSLGLFIRNGPRFETPGKDIGATAVLETLLMKGSDKIPQQELQEDVGMLGSAFKFVNHRECLCFMFQVPRYHVAEGLEILNALVLHPSRNEEDFKFAKALASEKFGLASRDATRCCFELIHQAAWNKQGLGIDNNPKEEQINALTSNAFHNFHYKMTRPDRCVMVGTGITNHEEFVKQVEEKMEFQNDGCQKDGEQPISIYTGGSIIEHEMKAPESVKKFSEKPLSHLGLCFKGTTMGHPEYFAYSVIQTLLGGGSSFSSGGPGKGMHTKLFREVIQKEGWVHAIECVTAWYSDSGLVGLYGQAPHDCNRQLLATMLHQAASICQRIDEKDMEMAKNQLLSQMILLGESRELQLEEAGKMLLLHDKLLLTEELLEGVQHLNINELKRVCKAMMDEPMTFVVYGNSENLPKADEIQNQLRTLYKKFNK